MHKQVKKSYILILPPQMVVNISVKFDVNISQFSSHQADTSIRLKSLFQTVQRTITPNLHVGKTQLWFLFCACHGMMYL